MDEKIEGSAVNENPENPEVVASAETAVAESVDDTTKGASEGNGEQALEKELSPELQEKYKAMQRDYTEKTTKLANERKEIEEKLKSYEEKIKIFDTINSNPKAVEAVKRVFSQEEPVVEPTEDEIIEKYGSKESYILHKRIENLEKQLQEQNGKIGKTAEVLENERLAREVDEYGSIKGNEDFWELEEMGLIQSTVTRLRQENPKEDNLRILKKAHEQAREVVSNIVERRMNAEQVKQKDLIAKKKNETMDRGGSATGTTETHPKSYRDQLIADAKKLGIPIP